MACRWATTGCGGSGGLWFTVVLAQIAAISLIGSRRREALRAEARARFARGGPAFAAAIPDIDHIRLVNDRFGHAMGDAVRRTFGQAMSEAPGSADRVARQGGGEFLLLLS